MLVEPDDDKSSSVPISLTARLAIHRATAVVRSRFKLHISYAKGNFSRRK